MGTITGALTTVGGLGWSAFSLWLAFRPTPAPNSTEDTMIGLCLAGSSAFMGLGFVLLFRSPLRRPSKVGVTLTLFGLVLVSLATLATRALDLPGWIWPARAGALLVSLGLAIFGIDQLREKSPPRLGALPLLMLAFYLPSWMLDPANLGGVPHGVPMLLSAAYGAGWVTLGLRVARP